MAPLTLIKNYYYPPAIIQKYLVSYGDNILKIIKQMLPLKIYTVKEN